MLSIALQALAVITVFAAEVKTDWPGYRGANGQFTETSGIKLINDMTQAKLLWESEEKTIGFGKTDSGYGKSMAHFGDLMPAGIASPIVAGGLVIQFYAQPTGDVIDEASKAALTPENWEKYKHKARVDADDVVIAIDAATGKTRWKRVFASAGRNPGSGKRNLSGMTPVAADGKVFAMGTCGALYALDLKTGEPVWQLPNWPDLQKSKEEALAKRGPAGAACPTGWLMMVDGVLIVPVTSYWSPRGGGLTRGLDPSTGKTLWEAKVNPNILTPGVVDGKACLMSPRICLDAKTGKELWRHDDRPNYYRPLVFGQKLLIGFEPHPDGEALLQAKEANTKKGAHAFGVLAGYSVDEKGAMMKWTLPSQYRLWMQPDSGGFPSMATRNGLIYHLAEYQEKTGAPAETRLVVVRESDGTILASQPAKGGQLYLWGNRAIVVTDIYHRPRAANAEVWQMFDADPAKLAPLGKAWHVNGNPPVHMATGGYEMPLLEAFADGIGFFRVGGGIRAYDLRPSK
jgi:outer membrane protein assembly factor BamB